MKYILFGLMLLSAYNLYVKETTKGENIQVKTLKDINHKLETSTVSTEEILTGATELANQLCQDNNFQSVVGEDSNSCQDKLLKFKSICADHVFGNTEGQYSDKNEVSSLANRFVRCVST